MHYAMEIQENAGKVWIIIYTQKNKTINMKAWGLCGSDRKVVEFTTTYAISAYHH
jgi:hypothetical protein